MEIQLSSLARELTINPSPMMQYHSPTVRLEKGRLIVGYIADDQGAGNPLEERDGDGRIHRFCKDALHPEREDGYAALGRTDDGDPDFAKVAKAIAQAVPREQIATWVERYYPHQTSKRSSRALIEEAFEDGAYPYGADYDLAMSVWQGECAKGKIGDPDAVLLDKHDHSGVAYSLAGEGMQCLWDTSRGAAVWVPDEAARSEIDRRAAVYAYGEVMKLTGPAPWHARYDETGEVSPGFVEWFTAFSWLNCRKKGRGNPVLGRQRACNDLARHAVELYNNWLNGHSYMTVHSTLANLADDDAEPDWREIDYDCCGGYYGDDDAISALEGR